MSFVHPLFLWALTTLSVPVIIHLFNFRRTRKVFFSNTRLLQIVQEASSRKRKIRHLLVLASRMLFLFFLVLTFAQPFIPAAEDTAAVKKVVLYIDNSRSMTVQMPNKARALDHAISYARAVVEIFPRDTRYLLLTNDFYDAPVFRSASETLEKLAQVRTSSASRNFNEISRKLAREPLADLFYFSDFQRSTTGIISGADSSRLYGFIPIQPASAGNVYVDSAAFENPYLIKGEKTRLTIWLRNDSREAVDQLNVRVTTGNTLTAASTVSLSPLGMTPVVIDVNPSDRAQAMKVTIQDFPVGYDNEFFLTALPLPRLQVVHIYEGNTGPYIREVFGNRELFNVSSRPVSSMSFDMLDKADLIVMEGINKNITALQRHFEDRKDQKILFIPSENPDTGMISELFNLTITKPATTARLLIEVPSSGDPFFENVFESRTDDLRMPEASAVINWPVDRSAILRFKDGKPLLSRFGNYFLLASPLASANTNLATHAIFVPVMYRIAAASRSRQLKPYHFVNNALIDLPLDSAAGSEFPVKLTGPGDVVPQQRIADGRMIIDVPPSLPGAGNYYALRNRDTLGIISLNMPRSESMMAYIGPDELSKLAGNMPNARVFQGGTLQTFSKGIKERYLGIPLWKYCLILSLVFFFTEVLLLRVFKAGADAGKPMRS
ncbi:MAG: BatA domain-containing protein [Cyclobacteriaceae bacterium]